MAETTIEWCEHSINPIRARLKSNGKVGHYCEKVNSGCTNCYASRMQSRFGTLQFGSGQHRDKYDIFLDEEKLDEVSRRRKATKYFWCDMTDLFGRWVEDDWIRKCYDTMDGTPQHTHMLLTKRPQDLIRKMPLNVTSNQWCHQCKKFVNAWMETSGGGRHEEFEGWCCPNCNGYTERDYRPNVWLGASISDQETCDEVFRYLKSFRRLTPVVFVSFEPIVGPIKPPDGFEKLIDWAIIGGESGPGARLCKSSWMWPLLLTLTMKKVPTFVKQLGSNRHGFHRASCLNCGSVDYGPCADGSALCNGCDAEVDKFVHKKAGDPEEWEDQWRVREYPQVA